MKRILFPLIAGILLAYGVLLGLDAYFAEPVPGAPEVVVEDPNAFHIHSDFVVYMDNQRFNFAQEKYMTSTDACHNNDDDDHALHLHNMNGNVMHSHVGNKTWVDFFNSLNFKLEATQFTTAEGAVYKNTSTKKWRYFVNGVEKDSLQDYVMQDLDKVLITYGTTDQATINTQLASISSEACIFSKKCPIPEGMVLPPENCGS